MPKRNRDRPTQNTVSSQLNKLDVLRGLHLFCEVPQVKKAYKSSATMQAIKAGFKINAGPLARGKLKSPRAN